MQVLLSDSATWVAVGLALGAASLALVASLVVLLVVGRRRRSSYAAVEEARAEAWRARARGDRLDDRPRRGPHADARGRRGAEGGRRRPHPPCRAGRTRAAPRHARHDHGGSGAPARRRPAGRPTRSRRPHRLCVHARGNPRRERPHSRRRVDPATGLRGRADRHPRHLLARRDERSDEQGAGCAGRARSAGRARARNARRFREARQIADLDALTTLHNRRYFHETLGRECARAHRYDRQLALVIFDIDDFASSSPSPGFPTRSTSTGACSSRSARARSDPSNASTSRPGSRSSAPTTTRPRSSSEPTRPSTRPTRRGKDNHRRRWIGLGAWAPRVGGPGSPGGSPAPGG